MNVVITGASRGIGLGLAELALEQGHKVLAVVRDSKSSSALMELSQKYQGSMRICETDVASPQAPSLIAAAVQDWSALDLLINNAGVLKMDLTHGAMIDSFSINTVAPLLIAQALLPKLQKSKDPKVVNVTSRMGSVEDNSSGGYYAYRASKSALNMVNKSLSIDNPWLTTIVVHPGWVKTDMGGAQATTEIHESVAGIWKLATKIKSADSGEFFDFQGETIPW